MFLQFTDQTTGEIFRCTCADSELHYIERVNKKLASWCKGRIIKRENSDSSFPGLTLAEFKRELRSEVYFEDRWGCSMGAFFALCSVAYERDLVQTDWEYRPGAMGNVVDSEDWFTELFLQCSDDQLTTIGTFLLKLTNLLRLTEHAY